MLAAQFILTLRIATLGSIAVVLVFVSGCAVATESRTVLETDRIIENEPTEFFQRDSIIGSETVMEWNLGDVEDRKVWKVDLSEGEFAWTLKGLEIDAERRFFSLVADIDVDASNVDVCEVEVHDLYKKPVTISWAAGGEAFSKEAQVLTDTPIWSHGPDERYRLVLKGHPLWTGKIEKLKIAFVVKRTNVGLIKSMALSKEHMKGDAVAAVADQAWRFDIDNEVRSGWIGVPSNAREEVVSIPRGGRLSFSMGSMGSNSGDLVFRIVLTDRRRQETTIFNEAYSGEHGAWLNREIDVSAWAGQEVVLRFETENVVGGAAEIPVWGNPVLVSPSDFRSPNIVLIDLDTLRADHMSIYGYDRQTTPNIDAWTERSAAVVFENTIAAASWTLPSHVSMFTAMDTHKHGIHQNKPMPLSMQTLAEILRAAGYSTIAVTGGGFVHSSFGFAQGFDEYRSFSSRMGFENEIEVTTRDALKKLERYQEHPFFLFFHTYEIHNPYRPRMPGLEAIGGRDTEYVIGVEDLPRHADDGFLNHRQLVLGTSKGERFENRPDDLMEMAIDLYDAGIVYADKFVNMVLARIDELELANNTIVVITSDHGELFGEHGEVNHYCVYDGNVYVPLIISAPGVSKRNHRVRGQVRSIDLMPTLLDLVGLAQPEGIDGVTLRNAVEGWTIEGGSSPALSYASGSNFGMSIRDNGLTYILRNGAWYTEKSREEYFQDGVPVNVTAQVAFAGMREAVGRELEESLPGLRVVVSNIEGSEGIEGVIRGPLAGLGSIKIFDVDSAILRKTPDGGASFMLEPGRRVTWILQGSETAPLFLELGEDHFRFEIEEGQPIQSIVRSGKRWVEAISSDAVRGDGVFLWRVGAKHDAGGDRVLGEDLQRQLEALGYVE